jgi:GR25 family glycosyltransferase involved in LPS biosynthesis
LQGKKVKYINVWGLDYRFSNKTFLLEKANSRKSKFLIKRKLTLGEICCALGHRQIYSEFLETGLEWALILEDDARFISADIPYQFPQKIERSKPCIIQLYGIEETLAQLPIKKKRSQVINNERVNRLYRLYFTPELTHAYFINRSAARKLYNSTRNGIYSTADWPLLGTRGLKFYSSALPVFIQNADQSLLAKDRPTDSNYVKQSSHRLSELVNLLGLKAMLGIFSGINPFEMQHLIYRRIAIKLAAKIYPRFLFSEVSYSDVL